jgi:hypothetical protein
MRQAGSYELFSYWNELRCGRAAPERADIDPAAIRNVLADTFILEVDAARNYPICLAGTRFNALFDTEVRGSAFLPLWNENQRRDVASALQIVTDGVCPVVAGARTAPPDYEQTEFELLLLPLRHLGKTHARVLGRIAPAKQPTWLGLIPVQTLDFLSMRVLETPHSETAPSPAKSKRSKREGDMSFASYEQRKHLRIYIGNA